jgi:hypothetical protein
MWYQMSNSGRSNLDDDLSPRWAVSQQENGYNDDHGAATYASKPLEALDEVLD